MQGRTGSATPSWHMRSLSPSPDACGHREPRQSCLQTALRAQT
nr:MAG TPA: hypothetical protein [Caudoviricetes sp.]